LKSRPDVPIKDDNLLRVALRHRSVTNDPIKDSYERLEFFGDSVLGMIIAQYLYEQHPNWDQGTLSKAKATIVQEAPLAEAALRLGLNQHIQASPGESNRSAILADVFEAVIGALYIEQGMAVTRWFVLENLQSMLERVARGEIASTDYKSRLQEITQAKWKITPTYRQTGEYGDPHEKNFIIEVIVLNEVMGMGKGKSKKEAEQLAAKEALDIIERAEHMKNNSTQYE
jgi:ribonuclease-3